VLEVLEAKEKTPHKNSLLALITELYSYRVLSLILSGYIFKTKEQMQKMQTITELLNERKKSIQIVDTPTRINIKWEQAKEFCEYCGLKADKGQIVFVLKLFRNYGQNRVLGLKSWLKDAKFDPSKIQGLLVWRLSNDSQKQNS
jgi:hypothetical protein